eukprot:g859.t1
MPDNNTHALVSAPLRILQDSVRADDEAITAEWTSDDSRTHNSMVSTAFTPLKEQANTVLEPRQAQLKLSLSSSVARPSPQIVVRRTAQKDGRARVQNEGNPLPERRAADFAGHASAQHLLVQDSCLSSKHANAVLAHHAAMHENNGRAFRTKQCASRRRLHATIAATISAALVNEMASDCAPLCQKDAADNSTARSDGTTRELAGDIIQQPAKDFAAQVPAHSSEFGRKHAHETARNRASVCSAHSAASKHAALRHCRHEDASRFEACRTRTRRQHHGPCLSASRGLLVAMALLARLCHMEAAFTPSTRAVLQGDGTAGGGGVFGCVGECGQSLSGISGSTYCDVRANGTWKSGDGTTCANADSDVPSGQGDGKYGAIGTWNVGKVTNMWN